MKSMMKRWLGNAGNSMLEVMMAMVVTGIAATAATGGFVSTTNLLGENTLYHDAMALAQQSLERTRTIPYDEIVSGTQSASGGYTVTKTVLDSTPEVGMKHITVTVSWTWKGKPRTYALRTVFGELTKS
jgi:prepilin-type N-terminal cleavage/methylation domain-containing protein